MMDGTDDILKRLPARLREARQAQGLSLDAVSKLSGVSRSMVSQIERGSSSPTVATLWNLTRALDVDFAGLLDTDPPPRGIEVVRSGQIPSISGIGQGCRIRILSAPEDVGAHEIYDITFDPGGRLDSDPHGAGAAEQLTVLDGAVTLRSGPAEERLGPGDTARYAADLPHAIRAEGGPARVFLVVVTP